jgi:hypothetical protein
MNDGLKKSTAWWRTIVAVLWAFLGVRRKFDYDQDVGQLKPLHLLLVGFLAAVVFVATLMWIANWVVHSG